jgi:transglutaminase-like putative cysteine protease
MIPLYQIPRNTLLWLFAAQLLVLLPHIQRTPVWVVVLLVMSMCWRIQIFRGHWSFPKKSTKVLLTLMACGALVFSFPTFFGLEALVSVLLVAYALKLLEMCHKRDALIVLYLSFFLIMTGFLFNQSISLAVFNLLTLSVILTTLTGLYQHSGYLYPWQSFRKSAAMLLQAIPFMILMFVMLPRFPTFWSIPLQKNTPKTGMSDSMSPGDISRLAQSSEPVMRINFGDVTPRQAEMYWRGLVLSRFDGRRWQADEMLFGKPQNFVKAYRYDNDRSRFIEDIKHVGLYDTDTSGPTISYEVLIEETQTPWLYALAGSIPSTSDIWVTFEQLLAKNGFVNSRYKYQAISYPQPQVLFDLPAWERALYTRIPENHNPRSQQQAEEWKQRFSNPEEYVNHLLRWFNQEFYYTLQPPSLGEDSVDEFLFDSKKGFCEHFASSFVFMLRAAGIPARVVVGYQGGEFNPYEKYWLLRQYDAHAWAEVWITGKGWVRYDPTFAVAPQRILDGFRNAFEKSGELSFPVLSMERYRNSTVINFLRLQWDSVNYNWTRWVLSYDTERQMVMMTRWMGDYSITRIALVFSAAIAMLLAFIYAMLLWRERDKSPDPVLRKYRRFCRQMKKSGFPLLPGETPNEFLQRLYRTDPKRFSHLHLASIELYAYWYNNSATNTKELCKMLRV